MWADWSGDLTHCDDCQFLRKRLTKAVLTSVPVEEVGFR